MSKVINVNGDKMSEEDTHIYFTIRGGRQRQVSREEWELEWLRWWRKNNSSKASEKSY